MKPIRVLQVFASLDRGGAESLIMNIYRKIDRSIVQFDFVVNENAGEYAYEKEIGELGGRIVKIPKFNIRNYLLYRNTWITVLSEHPEWIIVHAHHTTSAFIYLDIAKSMKRVTIAHSHTSGRDKSLKSLVKMLMRYPLRNVSDYLFACSKSSAEWMFGRHSNFELIHNGIDIMKYTFNDNIRKDIRFAFGIDHKFVIGHVGRFSKEKNHAFIITIFKKIHDLYPNTILLLVGDGKLREVFEKQTKDLNLTNSVIFTGVRSDVNYLLQAMDVFLFPSLYEGLPVVLVEAQAASLRCFISDTITRDVNISDLVEFIPLKKPATMWAKRILNNSKVYERRDMIDKIRNGGYDIADNAKLLQSFYIKYAEENNT